MSQNSNNGSAFELSALKAMAPYLVSMPDLDLTLRKEKGKGLIDIAKETIPARAEGILVRPGNDTVAQNIPLFMDLLGVDVLVTYEDKKYAIDLTTAQTKYISGKLRSMKRIKPFLKEIGDYEPLVIQMPASHVREFATTDFFVNALTGNIERLGCRFYRFNLTKEGLNDA